MSDEALYSQRRDDIADSAFADATNSFSTNVGAFGAGVSNIPDTFSLDTFNFEGEIGVFASNVGLFGSSIAKIPTEFIEDFTLDASNFESNVASLAG